ncbi:MAG: 3-deoxy-D-manno-octulosonic acid transferase [Candidatus Paracaedibacteraceae bacterium]|nr:3-deoxy-D-manno-octulosonic acid transferase [Candidatus Paracaedibacteraceae bacterium]
MYTVLSLILLPIIWLYVHYRRFKGFDDPTRYKERFGKSLIKRPRGRLVWFHSASVGETLSLQSFVANWNERYPSDTILITTTTVTAAKLVAERFSKTIIHQFVPFDITPWIKRFLSHWSPDQVFFIESEIWPNIIQACKKRNIPLILLNARLSDRSFKRWSKFPTLAAYLLNQFTQCLAQGQETADRLKKLGVNNVSIMPNLKFSAPSLPINQSDNAHFSKMLNGKPIWIAASTHPGEEEHIFNVHIELKKNLPDVITILAPRHPYRANSLVKMAKENQLLFKTLAEALKETSIITDGIVIDSIGQLGTFYNLSNAVFMGGSLIPHGGQNPIEPIHFKKPILFGPHMHNFNEVCDILKGAGAISVLNEKHLSDILLDLLKNPNKCRKIGESLHDIFKIQQKNQKQLIDSLRNYFHESENKK